jgi:hypothetical protein
MTEARKIAAILAADVVGHSAPLGRARFERRPPAGQSEVPRGWPGKAEIWPPERRRTDFSPLTGWNRASRL